MVILACGAFAVLASLCAVESQAPNQRSRSRALASEVHGKFIENRGQWRQETRFVIKTQSLFASLQRRGFCVRLTGRHVDPDAVLRFSFVDSSTEPSLSGEMPSRVRYRFIGPRSHDGFVASAYDAVRVDDLYPGIQARFRVARDRSIEYDLVLAPHARLRDVALRCEGASSVQVDARGDLICKTAAGDFRMTRPISWEQCPAGGRKPIDVRFVPLREDVVGLVASRRSAGATLTVDPRLVFATHVGGSNFDRVEDVALDNAGRVVVVGSTQSPDFPTTPGAYNRTLRNDDAFVVRLSPNGERVDFATFIGGTGTDAGFCCDVSSTGAILLAGVTTSTDFPTTPGALTRSAPGGGDAFVLGLNPSGSALAFSTYVGGSGQDFLSGAAWGANGEPVIAGFTLSGDFPVFNAVQPAPGGNGDAFVTRLTSDGSRLVHSSYIGGSAQEQAYAIAADVGGDVAITGWTFSPNFPYSAGAHRSGGAKSVFVTRLSSVGSILFSAQLGGSQAQESEAIAFSSTGSIVVAGRTASVDFPTTPSALQPGFAGGANDAFLTEFSPDGSQLLSSTYFGGAGNDAAYALAPESLGVVAVVGATASTDFPTTAATFDATHNGGMDGFVARVDLSANRLVFSSYLGGSMNDTLRAVATDATGETTVGGSTLSQDFPMSARAPFPAQAGGEDGVVARLSSVGLRAVGAARVGTVLALALTTGDAFIPFRVASALGTGPIRVGPRRIDLAVDGLLIATIQNVLPTVFSGYSGNADAAGQAQASVRIPAFPALAGTVVHSAFVTLSARAPSGIRGISNTTSFTIQP